MKATTILRMSLRNLYRAPVRSSLTALGVIVGVAAVVATTSIGSGANTRIQETLSKPEARTIHLDAFHPPSARQRIGTKVPPVDAIRQEDYLSIRSLVPHVVAATPRIYVSAARARSNNQVAEVALEGVDVDGFVTAPRKLLEGTLFNKFDVKHASNVCVISESLHRLLYPNGWHTSSSILINGAQFMVIGIVDDSTNFSPIFSTVDLHVYMPFTSLLRRLDPKASLSISVQASTVEHVNAVRQGIHDVMEQRRSGRKADFRTTAAFEAIKTYADSSLTVARLLAGIGAVSLVVGGIGIMNIMLVSVSERTREIGVRLAVGTHCTHVLGQFLTEATTLSLLGGGIGIAVGWAASWVVTRMNGWPTTITVDSILTAFLCSAAVGIFFGYHPARRASMLNPIEALRAER